MTVRILLRVLAIVIAIAALVDPAITRDVPGRRPFTIVITHADHMRHAERLMRRWAADDDVTIHDADPSSVAAACPSTGGCIVVSSGDVPRRLTAGATVIGALRVTADDARGLIRRVDAPQSVHRDAAASMHITVTRPVARVDVFDGDVLVGSESPGEALDLDVAWVPLGEGVRALKVVADGDWVDVGVTVEATPAAVVVYEPEPTWMGTFVRRALDDDARFAVAGRTRVAPPVAVTRGGVGPLSAAAIADAGVVVVTSPQTLSATDVELLDRFVTHRGGSLIVIPDQRPSGAMLRLLPRVAGQQRDTQPREVGLLKVREWLTFEPGAGTSTLAAVDEDAVVMSRAVGRGRVIVSGALDSWRFRDATSNFTTFWTSLAWDAAVAAGKPLEVTVEHALASAGEPMRVRAELQSLDPLPQEATASAVLTCDGHEQVLRLWPEGRAGVFEGTVRPAGSGACELTVAVNEATAAVPLVVRDGLRRVEAPDDALAAAVAAHGGIVAEAGEGEADLAARAAGQLPLLTVSRATWPMRSPYWLILFAACLSSEWWLRRRSGLS